MTVVGSWCVSGTEPLGARHGQAPDHAQAASRRSASVSAVESAIGLTPRPVAGEFLHFSGTFMRQRGPAT